ncbi:3'-5' exonuclease [Halioxenophilus aromaticivorans]|uniref:3'-5' exonuclease n=1 Tax=Halioxenophilus aromaticivorans TaxID=1306992 RepID=A0AAV3U620_9ALTE
MAVDLETSSLSTADGEILSAGWVALDNQQILLHTAQHHLIAAENSVGQSAAIHHLRDCDLLAGKHTQTLLEALLEAAQGRVLLFHNASLDMAFLNQLCQNLCGTDLLLPYEDTLVNEKQKLTHQGKVIAQGDLTLAECRNRYHLPYYAGHNALNDALATAELYAAQQSHARSNT